MPVATGVLQLSRKGHGVLFDPAWPSEKTFVPAKLIGQHNIPQGARVSGPSRHSKQGPVLNGVDSLGGLDPEAFRNRIPFSRLTPTHPSQRFDLSSTGDVALRIVDLVAPIGKGTRSLIASPPKAGKTLLLEQIAGGIRQLEPDTRIIMVLVDERPEEVTHFRRNLDGDVFASSSDGSVRDHIALAELILDHVRVELECGHDCVVLVDSLTRMARSFNLGAVGDRRGRTLTGGIEAGALEIPRRFLGMARNIENGGSVTMIATAMVQTGSRMDDVIFEEFKSTANSELVLDRGLAQAYLHPAINVQASGTRKEHLLFSREELGLTRLLRRRLAGHEPVRAMEALLQLCRRHPSNEALYQALA